MLECQCIRKSSRILKWKKRPIKTYSANMPIEIGKIKRTPF